LAGYSAIVNYRTAAGVIFNPATAGAGTHPITYTYTNASGCAGSASTNAVVIAPLTAALTGLTGSCSNGAPVTLTGGTPAGGTYSGTGVAAGVFTPATAGVGTHSITYTVSNACGSSAASQNYTVTSYV